jgi:MFS family permease
MQIVFSNFHFSGKTYEISSYQKGIRSAVPLAAPIIAPLIGGILATFLDWRYSFILESLLALLLFFLVLVFLPETFCAEDLTTFNVLRPFYIVWKFHTLAS